MLVGHTPPNSFPSGDGADSTAAASPLVQDDPNAIEEHIHRLLSHDKLGERHDC